MGIAAAQSIMVSLDVQAFQKIIVHHSQGAKYPKKYAQEFAQEFFALHMRRRDSVGSDVLELGLGQGDVASSGVNVEKIVLSVFPQSKRRLLRQRTHLSKDID